MVESVDDFLRSSLGLSEGAFSFCWGRGGLLFSRGGTNEGSLIFLCFSLAIEERILIYLLASHSVP